MSNAIIEVKNLKKEFKLGEISISVLKGISFAVKKGEFVAITGASGSGKTTLFNQIGLLDRPTSGKVFIEGSDTSRFSEIRKTEFRLRRIGRVFQFFNLIPELTVLENIKLPMQLVNDDEKKNDKKAMKLVKLIGLEHRIHNKPSQISGGQMQLVAVARAMANDPIIILADEPTGNLDSKSSQQVIDIFKRINKENGKTIVMITHEKDIAEQADRIIHLTDGKIVGKEKFTLEFIESKMRGLMKNMLSALKDLKTRGTAEEDTAHFQSIKRAANEIKFLELKDEDFIEETKMLMRCSLKKYRQFVERDIKEEELLEDMIGKICSEIIDLSGELSRDRKAMSSRDFNEKLSKRIKDMGVLIDDLKEVDTKRELLVKRVLKKLEKALPKKQ